MLTAYGTPNEKTDIDKLERVQERSTKLIPELSNKPYSDRLKNLNLPTLKYKHYRCDMVELFKIIKGMYDPMCVPHFDFTSLGLGVTDTNLLNITVITT